jgi:hypothetical protein
MPASPERWRSIGCRIGRPGARGRTFWRRRRAISARRNARRGNACRSIFIWSAGSDGGGFRASSPVQTGVGDHPSRAAAQDGGRGVGLKGIACNADESKLMSPPPPHCVRSPSPANAGEERLDARGNACRSIFIWSGGSDLERAHGEIHLSPVGRGRANEVSEGEGDRMVQNVRSPVPPHPNPLPNGEREQSAARQCMPLLYLERGK